ncbi:MAG: SPOR domain-containing protein [Bacteroidales bacterium]|nr:SPOR domain-containing protein [Bacteroidales bacterium]
MENLVRDIRVSLASGMRVCLPGLGVFTVERRPACMRSGTVYPPESCTVFLSEPIESQLDESTLAATPAQYALAQEIRRQMAAGSCFRIAGWGTFVRDAQTERYVLEDAREDLLSFPVVQLPDVQEEAEVMFEPVFAGSSEAEIPLSESARSESAQSNPAQSGPTQSEPAPSESVPAIQPPSESSRPEPLRPVASSPASSPVEDTPTAPAGPVPPRRSFGHADSIRRRRKRRTQWLLLPGLLLLLACMAAVAYFAYTYFNLPDRPESPVSETAVLPADSPSPVASASATKSPAALPDVTESEEASVGQSEEPSVPSDTPGLAAAPAISASPVPSVADKPQETGSSTPDLTVYEPESTARYYVVVGSLTSESQAVSQIQAMSRAGGHALRIVRFDTSLYRLVAGSCATYAEASALLEEVRAYAPKAWIYQRR